METSKDIKDVIAVFVTASSREEAERISDEALKSHVAACATTIPTVHSKYWWEGKIVSAQESIVMLKTTTDKFQSLQQTILKVHSYEVPEIVAVPITAGYPQYLEWVQRETA